MTDLTALIAGIERLPTARILCVGDVMLDHYVYGQVERISPEAPIPVLRVERETQTLGGAGNVVRNLEALGAQACLISVLGNDAAGRELNKLVAASGAVESHLLVEKGRQTTVKTRYVAATQQMLRADRETIAPIDSYVRADLLRLVEQAVAEHQIVVVSDYAKGVLSDGVAAAVIATARAAGKPVVVDPKGVDYAPYRGATVLKPNRKELALATGMPVGSEAEVVVAARRLMATHDFSAVLVSLSHDVMIRVEAE
jgi:D-beta-D-heptose 7-phosphate kinase/D-beta-D-heptose 1-phosphate adenosyltransferase